MEQINYRCKINELFDAIKAIFPDSFFDSEIIKDSLFVPLGGEENLFFKLNVVIGGTRRKNSQGYPSVTENYITTELVKVLYKEDNGNIGWKPYLPFTISFNQTSGFGYEDMTYMNVRSGDFVVKNCIYFEDTNEQVYLFFGDNYFAIVTSDIENPAQYLMVGSHGEGDGDGGFILSSNSNIILESNNMSYGDLYSNKPLLLYYNKFGDYLHPYSVDWIDTKYSSVPYDKLNGYTQVVKISDKHSETISFNFVKKWYARCSCSLLFDENDTDEIPNYNNVANYLDEYGSPAMTNTLNGVSLLLPNYFYIDEAPKSDKHAYKYIFHTPEFCYCSMYNMMGGNTVQQNYPTLGNKFTCFSLSPRLEKYRKQNCYKGFAIKTPYRNNGIVVKQEGDV